MPAGKTRVGTPTVVATVMRPVATRLSRIEALLIEMRGVLDVHLKRIDLLQRHVDALTDARIARTARPAGKRT